MGDAIKEAKIYQNPMAIIQVLGGLAANPLLLGDDRYKFSVNDFPGDFHRYVFKAIVGIALQSDDGQIDIDRIDPIDVDRWLKNYPEWYYVFTSNDGAGWLRRAIERSENEKGKFHYYYNELKKTSLMNAMRAAGIDTSRILDLDLVDPVAVAKQREKFDAMGVKDILSTVEVALIDLKERYDSSDTKIESDGGDDIFETLDALKESPEVGAGFMSDYLTTALRGMRLGTVFVESAPQGVGKSRRHAGESARLAVKEIYDLETKSWKDVGYEVPTLLISSELTLKEVQYMWLGYVSGVPEERIVLNTMTEEEEVRVRRAAKAIKDAPLHFVEISNYDINDIENIIKKYAITKEVSYVFFDYVGTTQKILSSSASATKMNGLREDQVLLMFMERLKNLAKILNIFIYTSTQISGNWKEVKEADQQMIRGAKAIADKPDGGGVLLPVRESDRPIIEQYQDKGFVDEPTHVLHLYKNRGNPMVNIRIYGRFIRNICRWTDCFVTDFQGHMLEIVPIKVEWDKSSSAPKPADGQGETNLVPEGTNKKPVRANKVDIGELPEVKEDALPFEFDENGQLIQNESEGWGGGSSDAYQPDPYEIVGPSSVEDREDVPQEDDDDDEGGAPSNLWGGLDF